jgi:hypothetical protein
VSALALELYGPLIDQIGAWVVGAIVVHHVAGMVRCYLGKL